MILKPGCCYYDTEQSYKCRLKSLCSHNLVVILMSHLSQTVEVSFQPGYMTNATILIFTLSNFHFFSSNIPSSPSYGVYISQLIRYARCCSHYEDFRYRHKCLADQLLSQGYRALRLEKSFKENLIIHICLKKISGRTAVQTFFGLLGGPLLSQKFYTHYKICFLPVSFTLVRKN